MILLLYLALLLFSATAIDGLTLLERKGLKECQAKDTELRGVQFENIWRPTLRNISRHGLASIFSKPIVGNKTLKVAIIGAGPSGLTAAYELAQYAMNKSSRIEVTIFEKTERVGGRVKTVGNPGHFLPEIWNNIKEAFQEAGAMRLPLPPQHDFDCLGSILPGHHRPCKQVQGAQCNISKMTDAEISDLVHQKGNYDFVDDQIFPMFLIRHYMKKFNVPTKRFNMDVSARNVFGNIFVHDYEAGTLQCKSCHGKDNNISLDGFLLQKINRSDPKFAARIQEECNGSLYHCFQLNVTDAVIEYIRREVFSKNETRFNLTTWEKYQHDWSISSRELLKEKSWPDDAIELYGFVYQFGVDDKIAGSIIESYLGRWWQYRGMFCPKDGMHTIYNRNPLAGPEVSSFYDELLKFSSSSRHFEINFNWNSNIKKIHQKKINGTVSVFKDAAGMNLNLINAGEFDAVIITVPVNFLQDMNISSPDKKNPEQSINIAPKGVTFGEATLFKTLLQFKMPFWNNTANNLGNFAMTNASGFTRSTDIVGQFRYPHPDEAGNVILLYIFPEKAGALAHKVGQHGFMKKQKTNWTDGQQARQFDSNARTTTSQHTPPHPTTSQNKPLPTKSDTTAHPTTPKKEPKTTKSDHTTLSSIRTSHIPPKQTTTHHMPTHSIKTSNTTSHRTTSQKPKTTKSQHTTTHSIKTSHTPPKHTTTHHSSSHPTTAPDTSPHFNRHFDSNAGIEEVIKMTLRELKKFHPHVDMENMYNGNYFVQPWVQLSNAPSTLYEMKKMIRYVDRSPKGIYFAGDGFSFKPQWQEGGLYAAYHAIWRLIHDATDDPQEDPFQVLPPKDAGVSPASRSAAKEGEEGDEAWLW